MDIGLLGKAVVGIILGAGVLWWVLRKLNEASEQKARADTLESQKKGDSMATEAEVAMRKSAEEAKKNVETNRNDPTDL
jgi:hypothetical protein